MAARGGPLRQIRRRLRDDAGGGVRQRRDSGPWSEIGEGLCLGRGSGDASWKGSGKAAQRRSAAAKLCPRLDRVAGRGPAPWMPPQAPSSSKFLACAAGNWLPQPDPPESRSAPYPARAPPLADRIELRRRALLLASAEPAPREQIQLVWTRRARANPIWTR
ncbi:hypothetical protein ZWY2020_048014 [Hordeum vulgare]|nr:hypothetical protein ZWY2020_048014 [Hordeum vulgare]